MCENAHGTTTRAQSLEAPAAPTQISRACAVEMRFEDFERHECTVNSSELAGHARALQRSTVSISCFTPTVRTPKCVHSVWGKKSNPKASKESTLKSYFSGVRSTSKTTGVERSKRSLGRSSAGGSKPTTKQPSSNPSRYEDSSAIHPSWILRGFHNTSPAFRTTDAPVPKTRVLGRRPTITIV